MYKAAQGVFSFTAGCMVGLMILAGYAGIASGNAELFQIIPVSGLGATFSGMCIGNLKRIEKKHGKEE